MTLLAELKRRRVIRALIGYGIAAFAVLQIVEPVMHGLHWPDSVLSYVVVALAIGFPVVVAFAWIFDVRQGGIEWTPPAPRNALRLRGARLAAVLVGIGLLAAAPGLVWYFVLKPQSETPAHVAVAVLPFVNLSGGAENEAFSDGLTEELMNVLAQLPKLRIAARTSSFSFKGRNPTLAEVCEKLHVTHVVEGSVRKAEGRVRIAARLEKGADGSQLWAAAYEEPLADVFALQGHLARAIAAALHLPESGAAPAVRSTSLQAYELYLRGKFNWAARPRKDREAIEAYEAAIRLDSAYPLALAGLAEAYATLGSWENGTLAPSVAFPKAKEAARKALEIDPALAEAHSVIGYILAHHDRAYEASEREFQTALRLRPDLPGVHHWYSHLLTALGRRDESLRESLRSKELDPLDPVYDIHLAWHYFFSHDYERALRFSSELAQQDPSYFWSPWVVALADMQLGRPAEAVRALQSPTVTGQPFTFLTSQMALAQAALGHLDEVRQSERKLLLARKERYVPAYDLALLRLALGDTTAALRLVRETIDEHSGWAIYIAVDPRLEPLSHDPGFGELLRVAGLADVAARASKR